MEAARYGYTGIVRMLLEKSANVNLLDDKEITALMLAAKNGRAVIVRMLLANDASVDLQDRDGDTVLNIAGEFGYIDIVKLLIARGAYINAQENAGITVLMKAAICGKKDVVELLINKCGPDVDLKHCTGRTAHSFVSVRGWDEIIRMLEKDKSLNNNDKSTDTNKE